MAAVTPGGHDVVSSGSTTARLGWRKRWEIPVFVPRLGKSTIATVVTSEPVPDVVGSASTGRSGPGTGRPPPSGALTQSRRSPPWAPRSAQIFTVSIAEPPPTPTNPSKLPSTAAAASRTDVSVGSPSTGWSTGSMPAVRSVAASSAPTPESITNRSQTTKARVTPRVRRWSPASDAAPAPKTIRGTPKPKVVAVAVADALTGSSTRTARAARSPRRSPRTGRGARRSSGRARPPRRARCRPG